jgi:thymidine kinase
MFAGKTRSLISKVLALKEAGVDVRVLKPENDTRYSATKIVSHDGARIPAEIVRLDGTPWPTDAKVIALDEAQFLTLDAVPVIAKAVHDGAHVILAGLDLTSKGEPFGPMPAFLALADEVKKLRARCAVCGCEGANRSYRIVASSQTVLVGGAEAYEPRCLSCLDGVEDV